MHTQASDIIIENGEQESLPAQFSEESANNPDGGSNGEDGEAEPVELLVPIGPCHRWERLLSLEGVSHVIVGNVNVGGDVVIDLGLCRGHCRLRRWWRRRLAWVDGGHGRRK